MAKVYISYSKRDQDLVFRITEGLVKLGHEILIDAQELTPGTNWRETLTKALKNADGIISIITNDSLQSQFVSSEIGAARVYSDINKKKFIIPVLFDVPVPLFLQDIQCLIGDLNNIQHTITQIHEAINFFSVRQIAEEHLEEKKIERIEANVSTYVEEAMKALTLREKKNNLMGILWYVTGILGLIAGVVFSIMSIISIEDITIISWAVIALLTLKTVLIIGLLLAISKYAFNLGKAYKNEALKNADRLHAISFGKFYLNAYGSKANWNEIKEAFQHWNIDKSSAFIDMNSKDYDPKFLESITELASAISKLKKE